MIELVTLDQVKLRLKYDDPANDANLQALLYGASRMVLNYLKLDEDAYADSDGEMVADSDGFYENVPNEVAEATILLVGILARDPDGGDDISNIHRQWEAGYLPPPVTAMLYPLRDPTFA